MLIQHLVQRKKCLLLCPELMVRMHKMSCIQHQAFLLIMDTFQQKISHLRTPEIQSRPPQIFHEKPERRLLLTEQLIDEVSSGEDDFLICMLRHIGKTLQGRDLSHMENHIFCTKSTGGFKILTVVGKKLLMVHPHPVAGTAQMDADRHIRQNQKPRIRL